MFEGRQARTEEMELCVGKARIEGTEDKYMKRQKKRRKEYPSVSIVVTEAIAKKSRTCAY